MKKIFLMCLFFISIGFMKTNIDAVEENKSKEDIILKVKKVSLKRSITRNDAINELLTIYKNSTKKAKKDYDKWKINEMKNADKLIEKKIKDTPFDGGKRTISETLDDGTVISVTQEDIAIDENGNPLPEVRGKVWKNYNNRQYTYTKSAGISPIDVYTKMINKYHIGPKGLTAKSLDVASQGVLGVTVEEKYYHWADKTATKVGHDIDSVAKWKFTVLAGMPIFGSVGHFNKWQRSYIKIEKWDKKNKKMYLNQYGTWKSS